MGRAALSGDFSNRKRSIRGSFWDGVGVGRRHSDWGPMIWMSYPGSKQSTVADRKMWGPEGGPPAPLLSVTHGMKEWALTLYKL